MKTVKLTVLLVLSPLVFFAQTLTGLWVGSVSNDSATIRKDQSFEIVLTQYKNKVYGYSRGTFIVNDTLFYIVKRVKGTIDDDICEVKDDEIVSYNFHGRLDKGVKTTTIFRFDHSDSTWRMDGDWKTNKTKKYYALTGKATLSQEKDISKSKIFPHLEELKLADDVEFYKESKKQEEIAKTTAAEAAQPVIVVKRPDVTKENTKITSINKDNVAANPKSEPVAQAKKVDPVQTKQTTVGDEVTAAPAVNSNTGGLVATQAKTNALPQIGQAANDNKTQASAKEEPKKNEATTAEVKTAEQNKEPGKIDARRQETVSADPVKDKTGPNTASFQEIKPVAASAALMVASRKITAPQVVNFKSDSLLLSLYDNGEVDGDTVSVLLNGELIIAKQELKVSAIKKTIYVPSNSNDSLTLVLYAENLGKYPPNTGLLIVHDGNETYQIRFSADLQQNAAIIFKRKRN